MQTIRKFYFQSYVNSYPFQFSLAVSFYQSDAASLCYWLQHPPRRYAYGPWYPVCIRPVGGAK